EIVGIENASHIFTAAKHPKSFVSLAGADHLLSRRSDAAYVANVIAAWAERYLDMLPARPQPTAEPGVRVRETRAGRFQRAITVARRLDHEQRARLLEIADKCPVHRTLTSEIEIRTTERRD